MKALLCRELGAIDALRVEDVASPRPDAGQVLIDVKAAAANFPDVLMVEGKYQFKPPMPFAPGCEVAGHVIEVGAGVTRVKALTGGRGVDVVLDPVGGPYTEPALRSLAWRGRLLVVGFANGEIPRIPLNLALLKGCSIVGVFWGDFTRREPEAHAANTRQLVEWMAAGELEPLICERLPLARGAEALRLVKERRARGKVLVLPEL